MSYAILRMARGLTQRSYAALRMALRILRQGILGATACKKEPQIWSYAYLLEIDGIQGNT